LLGDIPLIGNLFKHKQTSSEKNELMIFLTPHVVQSPKLLASMADNERTHMLAPSSYDEKLLDRFLENVPVKGEDSSSPKTKKK
jgi:type II secretory pathway component GspD/PulD (secretin)